MYGFPLQLLRMKYLTVCSYWKSKTFFVVAFSSEVYENVCSTKSRLKSLKPPIFLSVVFCFSIWFWMLNYNFFSFVDLQSIIFFRCSFWRLLYWSKKLKFRREFKPKSGEKNYFFISRGAALMDEAVGRIMVEVLFYYTFYMYFFISC